MENRARFGKLTGELRQERLASIGQEEKSTYVNFNKNSDDPSG